MIKGWRETIGYQSMLEKLPLLQPGFFDVSSPSFRAILPCFFVHTICSVNARRLFLNINKYKIFWSCICFYLLSQSLPSKYLKKGSESGEPGIFKNLISKAKCYLWLTSHFVHVVKSLSSRNLLVPLCLHVPIFSNRPPVSCIFSSYSWHSLLSQVPLQKRETKPTSWAPSGHPPIVSFPCRIPFPSFFPPHLSHV